MNYIGIQTGNYFYQSKNQNNIYVGGGGVGFRDR